jgi:hypothetical protein
MASFCPNESSLSRVPPHVPPFTSPLCVDPVDYHAHLKMIMLSMWDIVPTSNVVQAVLGKEFRLYYASAKMEVSGAH